MKSNRQVQWIATKKLNPYPRNARTHSEEQINQVVASIKEFGWTTPIIIDEKKVILAGHARWYAAQCLEMKQVPCIAIPGLSQAQKRAYVIVDNKLSENAGWNEDVLKSELLELQNLNFDMDLLAFDDADLKKIMSECSIDTSAQNIPEQWNVLVECEKESRQIKLMKQLEKEGWQCRALIS